ncbi:hypothetical protein QOL99_09940 [Deinococcus sp. MIMF12]|uniref:Penicillin-binding C-terminal domain-containing protein n=1 Tax=Deinococcus rhizophilus TaxID=3049544 RepID=A0ABT7JHD3_9DEIO|nr:hypothetical protein [Deinococcus rhizophilus]MDL2344474.1 hypothetical protein [Deinococcus rhizophilus]
MRYSHNVEEPHDYGGEAIHRTALRLRALTGLDPLTIDQTAGLSTGDARRDDPVRRAVLAAHHPRVPSVLQDGQGRSVKITPFQRNDLQVFHPDPVLIAGRPGWLYGEGRTPARVRVAAWAGGGRRLVQAFPAGGPADAVPADQLLMGSGGEVTLLLMPGPYRLALQDEAGHSTPLGSLTVR